VAAMLGRKAFGADGGTENVDREPLRPDGIAPTKKAVVILVLSMK